MLTCFGMLWNYDKFSRENTNFSKKFTLLKTIIDSKLIVKSKWHIGATINKIKKSPNISLENSSLWKYVFLAKGSQKGQ